MNQTKSRILALVATFAFAACSAKPTRDQATGGDSKDRQPSSVITMHKGDVHQAGATTFLCGGDNITTPTVTKTVSVDLGCFAQRAEATPAADLDLKSWILLIQACKGEVDLSGCTVAEKRRNNACLGKVADVIPGEDRTGASAMLQLDDACMSQSYTCPVLGQKHSIPVGGFYQVAGDTLLCAPN